MKNNFLIIGITILVQSLQALERPEFPPVYKAPPAYKAIDQGSFMNRSSSIHSLSRQEISVRKTLFDFICCDWMKRKQSRISVA